MIVDYPWSHPGGGALKARGIQGVVRYLSHDVTKTLLRPEADDLASHGIPMALVFEDMATRAADGFAAGANDAQVAIQMATGKRNGYSNLEMPDGRPIYFAADFDSSWSQIAQYYAGAASVLGKSRVGVYGGLAAIEGAANAGYTWLWQTVAWSHGQWSPKATLRQQLGEVTINGVQCDINDHQQADWGQWFPGEDIMTPQDKQDIIAGVWNHDENDAATGKPVRMGAVMGWMDKIHGEQNQRLSDLEKAVNELLTLMKADKS